MRARPSRGFTLVELLVATVVSAIVIAGVYVAVNHQQRAHHNGERQRAAQGSARDALLSLERIVPIAGYGMDAPLALDLDRYAVPAALCPAPMAGDCFRDSTNGPDELVVMTRDPTYWTPALYATNPAGHSWRITALTADDVTFVAHGGERFAAGQILQAVCRGGSVYAYFTVRDNAPAAGPAAAGPLTVTLATADVADPYRQQGWATNVLYSAVNACFASGQARLFLINRYRFHVRPVQTGQSIVPYLLVDQGKDVNFDGTIDERDETVLAEGIEDFQVAYVMNNSALAPRGLAAGTAVPMTRGTVSAATQSPSGLTTPVFPGTADGQPPPAQCVYAPSSFYPYSVGPPSHALRNTDHQANVVAVRIGIVARAVDPEPDPNSGELPQSLYNRNALPSWVSATTKYARVRVEATLPLRNTYVRGMNDF